MVLYYWPEDTGSCSALGQVHVTLGPVCAQFGRPGTPYLLVLFPRYEESFSHGLPSFHQKLIFSLVRRALLR